MLKQTKLGDVPVGTSFKVWDREFIVLDRFTQGVFVLSTEIEDEMPFRDAGLGHEFAVAENDFRDSSIRRFLNEDYLNRLGDEGARDNDTLGFTIDLKCTLGQHEYGKDKVMAGLLTLEQYGQYYDIIPKVDSSWWLATPWVTPNRSPGTGYTAYTWLVSTNGSCYYGYCSYSYGVRPTLVLNPSLMVDWDDGEEAGLEQYSTEALLEEIKRRTL